MSVSKHSLEIAEMEKENAQLRACLERAGWGPCNIPACNCNGWHHLRPARYEQEMIDEAVEQWKDRATAAEFRLSCAVNANTDHEQDYLAVWKLIKQPNETVVDAVKRVVGENESLREQLRTERERTLLYAVYLCDSKNLSFKSAGYRAAIDDIRTSLLASIERVQSGEQMEAVAVTSSTPPSGQSKEGV